MKGGHPCRERRGWGVALKFRKAICGGLKHVKYEDISHTHAHTYGVCGVPPNEYWGGGNAGPQEPYPSPSGGGGGLQFNYARMCVSKSEGHGSFLDLK